MKKIKKETADRISYTHFENDSHKLCVLLSGTNYLYDKPLMYYTNMAMLQQGYDVVQVNYTYEDAFFEQPIAGIAAHILKDVKSVIVDVCKRADYDDILFVGKSLGTIPMSFHFSQKQAMHPKLIMLTPVLQTDDVYKNMLAMENELLLIIGDADPHYDKQKVATLNEKDNVTVLVIPNANHSLDVVPNDMEQSLASLTKVMQRIRTFI